VIDLLAAVRLAWRAITAHRLRSALTVLGVVVGIGSVIAFATFGASVQTDVVSQFETAGASEIYLTPASPGGDGGGPPGGPPSAGAFTRPVFTAHDVERLRAVDGVDAVVPRGIVTTASVTYGNRTVGRSQVTATTPAAFGPDDVVRGERFTSGADEIVLNEVATRSFEGNVSVGDTIAVTFTRGETQNLTVVGVVSGARGSIVPGFVGATPRFYVPADPFYQTTVASPTVGVDQRAYPQVTVVADSRRVGTVENATRRYLRQRSDAAALLPDSRDVSVQSSADVVEGVRTVIDRITRFVTGIAVMSLIVGAFGIANIMLVSVTERTAEIGVMKSVGATNREVMTLFLVESVTLGGVGALVGIPVGLVTGYAATRFADVGFTVAVEWVGIAVVVGLLIGILAGLYPAWRAARVDPIEALRYE
jgi:putative ABC transport system permease protein